MKKMKTLASLVLAIVLAFALTIPAFADGNTGTITINSASKGETYKLVKLFDAKVSTAVTGGVANGITYTGNIPTELSAYFTLNTTTASIEATADAQDPNDASQLSGNAQSAIKEWAEKQEPAQELTATGNVVTFTNVPYGYYVVLSSVNNGAAIAVTSTQPNAVITEKNAEEPKFEDGQGKKTDKETVAIGEVVTYTVTYTTANYIKPQGATEPQKVTKYVVTDTLPDFLSNVRITEVKVGNTELTASFTFDGDGKFEIPWVDNSGNSLYDNGLVLSIEYSAVVTAKALDDVDGALSNTITIAPNDESGSTSTEVIYTSKINVVKYAGVQDQPDNKETKLEGAKFQLKNSEGNFYKYTEATETEGAKVEWVAQNLADIVTTDANGNASFAGLKDGTYTLIETEPPAGYNLPTNPETTVTVDAEHGEHQTTYTSEIANYTGAVMPSTGGIGTTLFYTIGGLLLVCSAILLVTKKRMSNVA